MTALIRVCRSSQSVMTWQGALWSPTDGTDSHRDIYTNLMIIYHWPSDYLVRVRYGLPQIARIHTEIFT